MPMSEKIKRRIVLTTCIATAGLSALPAGWREPLSDFLNPIANAYAYKVEKVCEETMTKQGPRHTCKSVLVKADGSAKKNDPAKDEKKDSAKSDAKRPTGH